MKVCLWLASGVNHMLFELTVVATALVDTYDLVFLLSEVCNRILVLLVSLLPLTRSASFLKQSCRRFARQLISNHNVRPCCLVVHRAHLLLRLTAFILHLWCKHLDQVLRQLVLGQILLVDVFGLDIAQIHLARSQCLSCNLGNRGGLVTFLKRALSIF